MHERRPDIQPLPDDASGAANAFKHALWAASLTEEFGPDFAKKMLDANERWPGNHGSPDFARDIFNNHWGIEGIGKKAYRARKKCERDNAILGPLICEQPVSAEVVREAVAKGVLIVLKPDDVCG